MENKFDYLEIKGTYKEVGAAIGAKFKDIIQKRISARRNRILDYEGYLRRTEPYFNAVKETFPNLIDELTATAKASGVSVADYFSINNREVAVSEKNDHCTVAVSFGEKGAIVGHNEDWENASPNALYILKATIGETTFLGLQYKVAVPGVSATMNNWGLVQCINDLNTESQIGVPKNFVARAILECKTLDEAEEVIRKTKKASGFNHVLVQGREVRNIEIAGDKIGVERVLGKPYIHTNHYLTPELKPFETSHTKSSEKRYKRGMELIKPNMEIPEMEALLSNTENKEYPISRKDATLGSFVAVPEDQKVYICYGPPDKGKYIKYE